MAVPAIGVVGLGALGTFVAKRLEARGYPVMVCDPDPKALQAWIAKGGGNPAASAAQLAQMNDGVVLTIPAEGVMSGPNGLGNGLRAGSVVIDMSGADTPAVQASARGVVSRGALWMEAVPVGVPARMTLLTGGADDVIARAAPLLEAIAARVVRIGQLGTASLLRGLAGALGTIQLAAFTEALVIARKAGLQPQAALDGLAALAGLVGTPPEALRVDVIGARFDCGLRADQALAALDETLAMARAERVPAPIAALVREQCVAAALSNAATGDGTDVARWLQALAGVSLEQDTGGGA